ncbi:DUF6520 family protein [Ferruginibacter sp. HRS2-29]|uniref:DUF6520 family protein n=1 Tax=Ferruginibacter sp. HRS2-29 TaxID=2487334 RepID=UPI0020CF4885|nr:DUF6520 family protein [Ferruginibacter sp. HRS2-29]MCP9749660.1 hypothetical protein [Ferruginibacter sp. HRS2-29]
MKTLKFPAFLLAFVIAITSAFAFNTKPADTEKFSKTYYFIGGNSLADVKNPSMWIEEAEECGEAGNLPCKKVFTSNVRADFDTHIAGYTSVNAAKLDANETRQ